MNPYTYTLHHKNASDTFTDDPKVVIAHARVRGHRATWTHATRPKSLPRLTLPELTDQPAEKVYQTVLASIVRSIQLEPSDKFARVVGRTDGDGYRLTATDGTRALMVVGDNGSLLERLFPPKVAKQFTPGPVQFVLQQPFAKVWRRMSVCANGWIDLELTSRALMLSTRDADGDTATEVYPLGRSGLAISLARPRVEKALQLRVSLNPAYLTPLLRCWPITVAYRPRPEGDTSDPPLVFSPAGAAWRYVLMGRRLT